MRYVIYGAGAIGGAIAARLAEAEREVAVIARGEHLDAIRKDGLRLETPTGTTVWRMEAVASPSELEWRADDVVILCMKTQDAPPALEALRAAAGGEIAVVCGQNGVANERMALRRFRNVYAMVVMLPAAHLEPGVVIAQSKAATGILDTGRYPAGVDAVARTLCRDLEAATFSALPDPAVMRLKYAKLLMNLGNALQAACAPQGGSGGEILAEARREAELCYAAAGIDCASAEEFRVRRADFIQPAPVGGQMRGGGSSWQSLARGKGSIESDYLNGEIVLLGRLHGVPTPTNAALQEVANEVATARGAPGSFPIDALRARIEAHAARG